ncbi:hypothetical protein KCU71_g72, partial [Aureobasidium melanogenum]
MDTASLRGPQATRVRETKNHLQRWQQVRCQRGRKEYVSVWKRDRASKQPRSQKQPSMSKSLSKCRATAFGWHRKKREMNIYSLQSLIDGGFLPLRQILNIGSANKELRTLQSSLCLPGPLLFTSNSGCKSCSNGTTSDQRQANVDGGVGGCSLAPTTSTQLTGAVHQVLLEQGGEVLTPLGPGLEVPAAGVAVDPHLPACIVETMLSLVAEREPANLERDASYVEY